MAAGGSGERAMKWSTNAWVSRERSLRSTRCSSREKVGALAKACAGCSGGRSTLRFNRGACGGYWHHCRPHTRRQFVDPLGQEVTERGVDRGRMPPVLPSSGKAFGEANLAVDAPQQEGPKVGRQGPTVEIGSYSIASEGKKTSLLWRRIGHKQTSWGFYGMDASHMPCYQRLTRGLCFFMKNSG